MAAEAVGKGSKAAGMGAPASVIADDQLGSLEQWQPLHEFKLSEGFVAQRRQQLQAADSAEFCASRKVIENRVRRTLSQAEAQTEPYMWAPSQSSAIREHTAGVKGRVATQKINPHNKMQILHEGVPAASERAKREGKDNRKTIIDQERLNIITKQVLINFQVRPPPFAVGSEGRKWTEFQLETRLPKDGCFHLPARRSCSV